MSEEKSRKAMLSLYGQEEKQQDKGKTKEKKDEAIYCGVGGCRPDFMQRCTNIGCVTVALSMAGLSTFTLNIYIISQITTLERQFGFSSSVSGILVSCNDLGYLLTTLLMSYLARRVHIPRALGISTLLYGISGLLCTIPFFATRADLPPLPNEHSTNATEFLAIIMKNTLGAPLCDIKSEAIFENESFLSTGNNYSETFMQGSNQCEGNAPPTESAISADGRELAIGFLAIGMMFQGFGKSPRQPFMGTYIDDNVPKTKTTLYLGIVASLSMFGPVLAYTLGGLFSRIYLTLEETSMSFMDPRWVGAWWLGFLLFGTFGLLSAVPMFFFPRRLRNQPELRALEQDRKQAAKGRECVHGVKDFLKALLRLFRTPVFMLVTFGTCVSLFGISGLLAFLPKYLETQFTIPAWKANIILGILNVLTSAGGTLLGGFLTFRFKLSPIACLKFMVSSTALTAFFIFMGFFLGCDQPKISMGASVNGSVRQHNGTYSGSTCQSSCVCDDSRFFPTCGVDGVTYFSPCHAGCTENLGRGYGSCSCIISTTTVNTSNLVPDTTPGFCAPDCNNLYPYIIMNFFAGFIATCAIMPSFIVSIRSISEKDKPLGIGLSAFMSTLLGWFLGPIVYGKMVDSCCILWSSGCVGNGSCSLYDLDLFRFRYHMIFSFTRVGQLLFYATAMVIAFCSRAPFMEQGDKIVKPQLRREGEKLVIGDEEEGEGCTHGGRNIFIGRKTNKI